MRIVLLHCRICSLEERSDKLCIVIVSAWYLGIIEALVKCDDITLPHH